MSVYIHLWLSLAQSGVSGSSGQVSVPQHLLSVKEKTVTGKAPLSNKPFASRTEKHMTRVTVTRLPALAK